MRRLEPAREAILARIPDIQKHRAYQLAKVLRGTGAIVPIGRRLYAIPEKLDAALAKGLPRVSAADAQPDPDARPAA